MAVRALGYQDVLRSLLSDHDAERAISITLTRGADNAYSFFRFCRRKIYTDDDNRDHAYLQRVRHFQHVHFGPQDPEWEQLNELMAAPLQKQFNLEISRKPFFKNHPALDAELRKINSLPPIFYEYRIPREYQDREIERQRESREARHCNPVHIGDVQTIVSIARRWRMFEKPWELVACASILCGRRTNEIVTGMEWEKESEYVARVRNLSKQFIGAGPIPLLIPYDEFNELMLKIRENELPTSNISNRFKAPYIRVFGEWHVHTERRNIYAEAAWRCRETSGFFPDLPRLMWLDKALCHDCNVIHQGANLSYQTATFDE